MGQVDDDGYYYGRLQRREPRPFVRHDWNSRLNLCPHYSDPEFDREQTVWGTPDGCTFYNYSDRLYEASQERHQRGIATAQAVGAVVNSARWIVAYLSAWHGCPVHLRHVMAGVNRSNGFGYAIYGYDVLGKEQGE